MSFEHYICSAGQRLRCGYTTGTCAALAAKAAVRMLLTGEIVRQVSLCTPKGWTVEVPVEEIRTGDGFVSCGVRKDGGDDIDVTSGLLICARVETAEKGIRIDGGRGVGRVTLPGLDQPVGSAAINRVPREMIRNAAAAELERSGRDCGLSVTVFVPGGEEAARRTFNPGLGIQGGISILGTSGIVEPRSLRALADSIRVELSMRRASGARQVILTPGNYGTSFILEQHWPECVPVVQCANFVGESIDQAAALGFSGLLLVGHIGKLVKVAGGIMDTHSRTADCRQELFCAHAALAGADRETLEELMRCVSADACLTVLQGVGLLAPVLDRLSQAIDRHLECRGGEQMRTGAVVFSNRFGPLFETEGAKRILREWRAEA